MEERDRHFVGNVAQKAIIECEGKVLVCRGVGDTVWEFPGGRLHTGETPLDGIAREIKEELGLTIQNVRPFQVIPSFHFKSNTQQVFVAYVCTCDSPAFNADETEVEEGKWITKEELKTLPMFDDCRAVADEFLK